MSVVHILDNEVADLIAAGEVVERPSSVIKELVENAIDARATKIEVEIKNGGISYMKVSDNGTGMSPEDAKTAFYKHATSKIKTKDDLYAINTLGFRGEALCAIAAVSNITLITKTTEDNFGFELKLRAGKIESEREVPFNSGTSICVENLFENTPARLKFLKSEAAETAVISSLVENLALSHPDVSFKLFVSGKEKFFTVGDGDLTNTVYNIFGKSFSDSMLSVELMHPYKNGYLKIRGFIGKPLFNRPNRNKQLFYINGRYIRSRILQNSLENAYKSYIMAGRFPICILFIDLNCEDVDINVHPSKLEAKFSDEKIIYDFVLTAVSIALKNDRSKNEFVFQTKDQPSSLNETKAVSKDIETKSFAIPAEKSGRADEISRIMESVFPGDVKAGTQVSDEVKYDDWTIIRPQTPESPILSKKKPLITCDIDDSRPVFLEDFFNKKNEKEQSSDGNGSVEIEIHSDVFPLIPEKSELVEKLLATDNSSSEITLFGTKDSVLQASEQLSLTEKESDRHSLIGECFDSYVIIQRGEDIIFIDKHALHERMNFERLKNDAEISSQILLSPIVCNVEGDKYSNILKRKDMLERIGFRIDDFGSGTVIVREIPDIISPEDVDSMIDRFGDVLSSDQKFVESEIRDEFLYDIACKASVKAGKSSSPDELNILIDEYFRKEDTLKYCPHGRPIQFVLSKTSIEKQFKRIR